MRIILLMLYALCSIIAMAQDRDYHPFCEEGKEWTMNRYHELELRSEHLYQMIGDTIVEGTACKKLLYNGSYLGALYEIDKKVYYILKGQISSHLLYDFGLSIGDNINTMDFGMSESRNLWITRIDTEEYNGYIYRHFKLETKEKSEKGIPEMDGDWYEGVGTLRGPIISFRNNTVIVGLTHETLRNCKLMSNVIFFDEADISITRSRLEAEDDGVEYKQTSFCQEGKKWLVHNPVLGDETIYELNGDTIINNITAYKMYSEGVYKGAFFDDCYKTFYIAPDEQKPNLFYNFSLYYGDITRITNGKIWVQLYTSFETLPVLFNGRYLNDMKLKFLEIEASHLNNEKESKSSINILHTQASQWIEGIGSLNGPMTNFTLPGSPESSDELLACWTPDEIIYDPQGVAAAHFTIIPKTISPIYDLSGRKMAAPSAHGVYIEGGKKVVR